MANNVVELNSQSFDKTVLESSSPVLVDFWAPWCGPCRAAGPIIEEIAGDYSGKLTVCKLDVDSSPDIAARYRVMSIPTVMLFKSGKSVERLVGVQTKHDYTQAIDKQL